MNALKQGLFDAGHDAGVSDGVMEVVSYSLTQSMTHLLSISVKIGFSAVTTVSGLALYF